MLQNLEHVFVFVFVFSPNLIGYSLKLIWLLVFFYSCFLSSWENMQKNARFVSLIMCMHNFSMLIG